MKRLPLWKGFIVIFLYVVCSLSAAGQQDVAKPSQLSVEELQAMNVRELQKEQTRLTQKLSDVEPFRSRPEFWQLAVDQLAKARLMGEIIRMQYLVSVLKETTLDDDQAGPLTFEPPSDPVRITIVQRHTKAIPGFRGLIKLKIGDITQGQVLLEIVSENVLRPTVDTISVQTGDVVPFVLGGVEYYLSVIELRNLLIGDDFGVFEISANRPDQTSEIERMLEAVRSSGLVFLRNGKDATAAEAAEHLRKKWRQTTPPITTVQGFLNRVASRSSSSGKSYQVKLADGSKVEANVWLRGQIEEPID
jgi:hypothetical protein